MPEIFINYRTGDGEQLAALLDQDLSRRFGSEKVFRAGKTIRPGQNFRSILSAASAMTQVLLVIIGPRWLDHDKQGGNPLENMDNWTRKEILNAIEYGATVVPILCGRTTARLSRADLPVELAAVADFQSIVFDTGNADADLQKIARHLAELMPGLTDKTKTESPSDEPGHTHNSMEGKQDVAIQAGKFHQSGGSIGRTVLNSPSGPVHTGDGPQFIGPTFHGGGNNYVAGTNRGGIHQSFGIQETPEDDR